MITHANDPRASAGGAASRNGWRAIFLGGVVAAFVLASAVALLQGTGKPPRAVVQTIARLQTLKRLMEAGSRAEPMPRTVDEITGHLSPEEQSRLRRDGWGTAFTVSARAGGCELSSAGPDRTRDTEDDLTVVVGVTSP